MVEYSEVNGKLTNVQLNKLKKTVKSNEGATLRLGISKKILIDRRYDKRLSIYSRFVGMAI